MSTAVKIRTGFREAGVAPKQAAKFEVTLLREGLGNLKDSFYYTKEALQSAVDQKLFDGAQCFADHPSEIEEQVRPERSTRDIIGYFENVNVAENGDGSSSLNATLVISKIQSFDWVLSLLTNSFEYATKFKEKDFVGLSINASGEANAVSLEEFVKSGSVPKSAIPKLMQAQEQGITELRVVNKLTEAVSCDLVTKAGAGGRILKLIEQEKSMKYGKEAKKQMQTHEDEDTGTPGSGGADDGHDDAAQDEQLFKKMIKQYLGKDDAHPEEMQMAKHAMQAYQNDGMNEDEAYEAAGAHLKMSHKIGSAMQAKHKQAKHKQAKHDDDQDKSQDQDHAEAHHEDESESEAKHHESLRTQIVRLNAQVAKLAESNKRHELTGYLEKKMKESKLPNSVTKKFREALGVPKSKEQIDSAYKMFVKAYEAREEVEGTSDSFFLTEKTTLTESEDSGKIGSFSDCLS